jgi:hypothetical protein
MKKPPPTKFAGVADYFLFPCHVAFAGFFGFFAQGFGRIALTHPSDPHALAGLTLAFVFAVITSYSTAVAAKAACNIAKM